MLANEPGRHFFVFDDGLFPAWDVFPKEGVAMFGQVAWEKLTGHLDWLWPDIGLRRKIAVLVIAGTLSVVGLLAYLGTAALLQNTERILQDRVVLARATASQIDDALVYVDSALHEAAAQRAWADPDQVALALERAHERVAFHATHLFLTDATGRVVMATPAGSSSPDLSELPAVAQALAGKSFAVSDHEHILGSFSSTVAAVPVRNATSDVTGALVVGFNLTTSHYLNFIQSTALGDGGYVDLVDRSGRVLASTYPARVGLPGDPADLLAEMIQEHESAASTGHACYAEAGSAEAGCRELVAFAPLEHAPWGIAVRQRESQVLSGMNNLIVRLIGLMVVCIAGDLALVYVTTRAVIRPVQTLTAASRRIAAGDLDTPVPTEEKDEFGRLARAFEYMRVRLADWSRALNRDVEIALAESRAALKQNAMLYAELQEKEQARRELLHRLFSAQEEERKRISRELHDETCQILNSLAYDLDNIGEMLVHGEATPAEIQPMLEKMRALAKTGRDGVSRIIFDLRPTMLDHLGLVPALRWYAETRLSDLGIRYGFHEAGRVRRLRPSVETALFRVVQEAVNNIAQHSNARHADFYFEYAADRVEVRVVDDGRGFQRAALEHQANSRRGLGLMGMEERMTAVAGQFHLQSEDGKGTVIYLSVPLSTAGADYEQDPYTRSG